MNSKPISLILPILLFLFGNTLILSAQNELKVMTYNIRYDNPKDGENAWPKRKEKVAQLVRSQNADIIGFQEVLFDQLEYLEKNLTEYGHIGVGRDDGMKKGEFSPIFYSKARFQLRDNGTFWLSETPEVPGSRSWDAAITRIVSWTEFIDIGSGQSIWVFNTHFDHKGEQARQESAKLLVQRAMEMAGASPIIIMGDFNFRPDTQPYKIINEGFSDSFSCRKGGPEATGLGFVVNGKEGNRIDHIFHSDSLECSDYLILDENDGKHYPSDHLPVIVTLLRR